MLGRLLFTLMVGSLVAGISGFALVRARTLMERELGVLAGPMDAMASDWDAKQVPAGLRAVTFLLSDAGAGFDPFRTDTESADALMERAGDWIGRNLIGGNPAVQAPTELGRAFADSTQLVGWTHRRFSAVGEAAMSRELEKAILKAHDAGAEINIIAQRTEAAPVLAALKRLQGVERKGAKVGANKVILLGVDADPGKLGNVNELTLVWKERGPDGAMRMRIFGGKRGGEPIAMASVWPAVAEEGRTIERTLRVLRDSVDSPKLLDQLIREQEARLLDEQAKKASDDAELTQTAEAAADAARKSALAQAAAVKAAEASKPKPAALASVKKEPAKADGPPPFQGTIRQSTPSSRKGWSIRSVLSYAKSMNGTDTGWIFEAPSQLIDDLAREDCTVGRPADAKSGVLESQCALYVKLQAIPAVKLDPRNHDEELQALIEKRERLDHQPLAAKMVKRSIHGHAGFVFKTERKPDGGHGFAQERLYFAVETGPHLIYLMYSVGYETEEVHERCLNSQLPLYSDITERIRPNQ